MIEKITQINGDSRFNTEMDQKIDIYAFSILLYELIFRVHAWDCQLASIMIMELRKGNRPKLEPKVHLHSEASNEVMVFRYSVKQQQSSMEPSAKQIQNEQIELFNRRLVENKGFCEIMKSAWEQRPERRPSAQELYDMISSVKPLDEVDLTEILASNFKKEL